ncbi:ribonuclease H-like domain-containing protein [Tanacetum coccineum]
MVGASPSGPSVVDSINYLDGGHPLHVQNSDTSNYVIVPFNLLGTENYRIWSDAVKLALQVRNKYGFVDGSCLKESYSTSEVLSAQWDRCNAMVLTWIMNVVSQDVYMGLVYYENVAVVWKELRETYDKPVRSSLLTRDPLPEVKDAYNVISREESHRGVLESSGETESKWNATSFFAKTFNNNKKQFNNNGNNFTRGSSNNVNRGPNLNLNCKHCGKISHTIDRCFEIVRFPQGFKRNLNSNSNTGKQYFNANSDVKMSDKPSSSSLSSCFTYEQIQKLLDLINDNLSMTTITLGWIIDSGANQHLTRSTSRMINVVDISDLKITIRHPHGTLDVISHVGNLKLANNVMLYDVLVVSGYCVSMLYMNKLIRDSKMFVGFYENKCYIQDLKKEKILGTGSESGGLYLFDVNKSNCIGQSNMVMNFHVSKLLWHNILGHPTDQVFSVLKKDLNISDNTFVPMCEICHRAKQTREPFPLSDHKSKTLGELVHLDLWGPYRVHSREGYRDVKFYKNVFPFKQKTCNSTDVENTSEVDHLQFFDSLKPQSPNDDGRDSSNKEGSLPHSDLYGFIQGTDIREMDKNKDKTGQNRARDWREREKMSPTVPSDLVGTARSPLNGPNQPNVLLRYEINSLSGHVGKHYGRNGIIMLGHVAKVLLMYKLC